MSDKVNYNTKVNFNEVIRKLHEVAKSFAEKVAGLELDNLAFSDNGGQFIGGGEYYISMRKKDGSVVEESEKDKFLKTVKEYVHYFCGDEEVDYIKDEDLQPLLSSDITQQPEQQEKPQGQDNDGNAQNGGNEDTSKTDNVMKGIERNDGEYGESLQYNGILNVLFEAEEDTEDQTSQNTDSNQQENGDDQKNPDGVCIGYNVMYDISVNGRKDTGFSDAVKNKSKGLFGGLLADLRNISVKVGDSKLNIGQVFDPEKWKESVGIMDIDINTVDKNAKKAFDNDFPNNDVGIKVWGKNPLITQLNRSGKLTPQIKSNISQADYSVVVDVNERDPNYPDYNTKSVASAVSKSFGTSQNLTDLNKVKDKDVIKIDNIEGLYKKKSEYDKSDRSSNGTQNTSKNIVTKESEDENVDSKKIKESITKNLEEQVNKELKNDTLQYGYQDVKQFSEQSYVKELNDSEFVNDLTTNFKNVLFIITKVPEVSSDTELSGKTTTDESMDEMINSGILNKLFENLIVEDGDEKDYGEIAKRIFKNVFINSSNDLGIKDVEVGKIKVYEKDVDISEDQVEEDDEQNKINGWQTIDRTKKKIILDEDNQIYSTLLSKLFGESVLMESSNYGKGVGIDIIKKKGYDNLISNIEKMKRWVKDNYKLKQGMSKEEKEKSTNKQTIKLIDQFGQLKTEQEMIKFIEDKFQDGGKDTDDDRIRTAFIKSMNLDSIPNKDDKKEKESEKVTVTFYDYDTENDKRFDEPLDKMEIEKGTAMNSSEQGSTKFEELNKKLESEKKDGFTFSGWNPEASTKVDKDTDVIAKYVKQDKKFTVTFNYPPDPSNADDIKQIDGDLGEQKVKAGESAKEPEKPEIEGWTFKKWSDDFDSVKDDMVIVAEYSKNIKIIPMAPKDPAKPDDKENIGDPIPYDPEKPVKDLLPEPPERDGWEATGEWEPDPDSIKDPQEDVIIVPKYEQKTPSKTSLKSGKGKLYVVGSVFDKKEKQDNGKQGYRKDWYIIPHKRLKDLSDRPHQENTDSNGVTTAKTSDSEYKP